MFLVLSKEFELKKVHGRNLLIVRDFLYQQSKIRLHRSSTLTANKPNCLANDPFCAWQWIREFLAYSLKQNTETISIVHYLWIVIKRTCSCWQRWSTEVEWWFTSRIRVYYQPHRFRCINRDGQQGRSRKRQAFSINPGRQPCCLRNPRQRATVAFH